MLVDIKYYKVPGVYKITNILTNTCYVGSSVDVYNRIVSHKSKLLKGKHHSPYLQNSFNKNGLSHFKSEVLEVCKKKDLITREQFFIDTLNSGYNMAKIAYSNLGVKRSKEFKLKMKLLKTGIIRSKEASLKCSETLKRIKHKPTKAARLKSNLVCRKPVINIITNEVFESLKEAARFYNICNKQLSNKLLGKRKNNTNLKYVIK